MAAPTDVRVEANSFTTTTLKWSYPSAATSLTIHRSTDGSAYGVIATLAGNSGVTQYDDSGLSAATKYWYKLSDDGGSTFSSVVTVITHGCVKPSAGGDGFSLPRFDGSEQDTDQLNTMARRVEDVLQGRLLDSSECPVCPVDGAIVIDCSDGCRSFVVIADQDINSISIQMCGGEGNIDFIIPPNTTRKICGWPASFGFSGDECFEAPISGGSMGRTMSVGFECLFDANNVAAHINSALCSAKARKTASKPGYSGGGGGGAGGSGGAGCTCVPKLGGLTIKSCNANNSLNCSSTKKLEVIACGGKPPYSWSKTGNVQLSKTSGEKITVTPPTNSGSGVAGTAYKIGKWHRCNGGFNAMDVTSYGCNDQVLSACAKNTANSALYDPTTCHYCGEGGPACGGGDVAATTSEDNDPQYGTGGTCFTNRPCDAAGTQCDARTPMMISNGCNPCGLSANSSTVSVTDAVGTVTTIILKN